MTFIANTALKVARGGETVTLRPGDPIPEAADWKHYTVHSYLRNGYIKEVPDEISALQARIAALEAENAALRAHPAATPRPRKEG